MTMESDQQQPRVIVTAMRDNITVVAKTAAMLAASLGQNAFVRYPPNTTDDSFCISNIRAICAVDSETTMRALFKEARDKFGPNIPDHAGHLTKDVSPKCPKKLVNRL